MLLATLSVQDCFGGPTWQATAPFSLTSLCSCLLKSHAEPNRVLPKVKEVPLSGILQTWPWPGFRSSPLVWEEHRAVKLFNAQQMGH